MRFHHSTRRGRNRLGHNSQQQLSLRWARSSAHNSSTSRWSQLGYCRETNIHFNRRLSIEPPASQTTPASCTSSTSKSLHNQSSKQSSPTGRMTSLFLEQQQQRSNPIISGSSCNQKFGDHKKLNVSSRFKQKSSDQRQTQDDYDLKLHKLSIEEGAEREKQEGLLNDETNQLNVDRENESVKQTLEKRPHYNMQNNNNRGEQYHCSSMGSKIDMESARQKLVAQVEKHRLWSSKAAKRMQLTSVQERYIYIYELISFCERRDLEWRYEPYKGGLVPSIPYRHIDQLIPPSSPTLNGTTVQSQLSKFVQPDLEKQAATAVAASTSDLFAFSPIHKKTVLVGSPPVNSQSPDSFWSTTNSSRRTLSSSLNASSNLIKTTSGISSTFSKSGSPIKQRTHFDRVSNATDRPIPSAEFVWSIDAPAQMKPEPFYSQIHSTELPNSSFVKRCHGCQGKGKLKCNSCNGVGYEVCISCHGNGTTKSLSHGSSSLSSSSGHRFKNNSYHSYSSSDHNNNNNNNNNSNHNHNYNSRNSTFANGYDTDQDHYSANYSSSRGKGIGEPGGITSSGASNTFGSAWVTESCHFCHGAGQKRCLMCAGKSYNHCAGCLGSGQLRCYLNLNITWINHRDEIVLNNSDNIIPKDRLRLCSGLMLVDEISENLLALNCATIDGATGRIEETNQLHSVSKKLLDKHKQTYRQERLIKQRHKVTQIECHVVNYEWKQQSGHFVIYGDERKVFIKKYPFKSFCNIT